MFKNYWHEITYFINIQKKVLLQETEMPTKEMQQLYEMSDLLMNKMVRLTASWIHPRLQVLLQGNL